MMLSFQTPSWCELPSVPRDFLGPLSVVVGMVAFVAVMVAAPEAPHQMPAQAAMSVSAAP